MLDPQNEQFDRRLARHLVSLYYKSQEEENDEVLVSFFYYLSNIQVVDFNDD